MKKNVKYIFIFIILGILFIGCPDPKAGEFDHIALETENSYIAGHVFSVKILALDIDGNPAIPDKKVSVTIAAVGDTVLEGLQSATFDGANNFLEFGGLVFTKAATNIRITAVVGKEKTNIQSRIIGVLPASILTSLAVTVSSDVISEGNQFNATVTAKDQWGLDIITAQTIIVTAVTGTGSVSLNGANSLVIPENSASVTFTGLFINNPSPAATTTALPAAYNSVAIKASLNSNQNITGLSAPFKVMAPMTFTGTTAPAGIWEEFKPTPAPVLVALATPVPTGSWESLPFVWILKGTTLPTLWSAFETATINYAKLGPLGKTPGLKNSIMMCAVKYPASGVFLTFKYRFPSLAVRTPDCKFNVYLGVTKKLSFDLDANINGGWDGISTDWRIFSIPITDANTQILKLELVSTTEITDCEVHIDQVQCTTTSLTTVGTQGTY